MQIVYALGIILLLVVILYLINKKYKKTLRYEVTLRTRELDRINVSLESMVAEKTEQLQEEKERLSKAEQISRIGSYSWNIRTDKLTWSDEHYRIFGLNKATFKPTIYEFMNFVHPDDRQNVIDELQNILESKSYKPKVFELRIVLLNRSIKYIRSISSITKRDEAGKVLEIVGTGQDITLQKESENTLAEINDKIYQSEKSLKEAQSIAHLGNWDWDIASGKIYWSDELFRIFGEEPQSFKPGLRHLMYYLPEDEQKKIKQRIRKILEDDYPASELACHIIRRNGEKGYVRAFVKIIVNDVQETVRVSGIMLDVTKEHMAEETLIDTNRILKETMTKAQEKTKALIQMKDALEQSNTTLEKAKSVAEESTRTKSSFLANMSHEIRTPLNAINGFIALLKESETDTEKLKYLNTIDNASHTLLSTINDILDFSKIESGKLEIVKTDFRPYEDIMATAELFQAKAAEKNIGFTIKCDPNMPAILFNDILRIKQVISNLLSNAIKFTPQNGEIRLSSEYKDDTLRVFVRDSGIGIPQSKQKQIFESFSQADSSTVREYGGSGLGLTISAQLVQMLKGELNVISTVGIGSTFVFSIPVREGRLCEREIVHIDLEKQLAGKVLLVEDNEANQMFIGLVLQKTGLDYEVANDGIEAIEKFETEVYDLILMDENMPRLNGRGATHEIRKIEKKRILEPTPIIALTANALTGDRDLFINAGMDDYLSKPVEPNTLIAMLHQFLDTPVTDNL